MFSLLMCLLFFACISLNALSQDVISSFDYSCEHDKASVQLLKFPDRHILRHVVDGTVVSEWIIRYPVYRFSCGDVTGDGFPDIAVGVEKSTRYRKNVAKRLFLFKLYRHRLIRPLWLGSHLGMPLQDFSLVRRESKDNSPSRCDVLAIVTDQTGKSRCAVYEYKGFGLKFVRFQDHSKK